MQEVNYYSYAVDNRIAVRNAAFSIEAQGKSADRVADAAAFAICCFGLAALIKALR
jgi:hypothetical protein